MPWLRVPLLWLVLMQKPLRLSSVEVQKDQADTQRAWAGGTKPVALDEEEEAAEDDTDDEELEAAASKPG